MAKLRHPSLTIQFAMFRTIMDRYEFKTTSSLRNVLFDSHIFTNEIFRKGFGKVARATLEYALENDLDQIVEMGAGTAPITQLLAKMPEAKSLRLTSCDRTPHVSTTKS